MIFRYPKRIFIISLKRFKHTKQNVRISFSDGTEGTDLEYESQFVFPNGFVDQNGIYYVNGKWKYSEHLLLLNTCHRNNDLGKAKIFYLSCLRCGDRG